MTDNFNFLGLPLVVQDLITEEIVHNSIPKDRIQLALTSKYCNELVQRARPKKIIDQFLIWSFSSFTFIANSKKYMKTKEQLMKILPNCQIKELQLYDDRDRSTEDYSEILDMIFEPTRFATKFVILHPNFDHTDKVVGFYVKPKHLKFVTLWEPDLFLPHYPSKVKLEFSFWKPAGNFLEDLEKKSQNCPLSFFELKCSISLENCQQFLQTAKFSTGAEICIRYHRHYIPVYLTYLGQNIFSLEMFTKNSLPILISQKFVGENRRILKLKRSIFLESEFTFNVVSALNPEKNYFSGVFKNEPQMLINLENVDRNEILVFKFVDLIIFPDYGNGDGDSYSVRPRYSSKMLESAFPTVNFTTPLERVEKINNVLGTNIQLIQSDDFTQTGEVFRKIH